MPEHRCLRQLIIRLTTAAAVLGVIVPAVWYVREGSAALQAPKPLDKPPPDQTFVGTKNCASCHLDQFLTWRDTKHAKAFDILPAKYKKDASCLKCHTTGHGEKTGFKDIDSTPNLTGASCETCHGPGSKHAEIAKSFGNKKLDKAEQAYVSSTIYKMQLKNVCVDCHVTRAHKKHPPYDKK